MLTAIWFLSGTADNKVRLWNMRRRNGAQVFGGTAERSCQLGSDRNQPFSVSIDKSVRFWNPADGAQARRSMIRQLRHVCRGTSADDPKLALAGDDKLVRIYQIANEQVLQTLTGHATSATSVSFSQDGNRLASLTGINELIVWDATSGQLLESLTEATLAAVFDFNGPAADR